MQILACLQYTKDRPRRHPNNDHAASRSQGSANKPHREEFSLSLGTAVSKGGRRGPGHHGSALLHTVLPCSCWCTELVPIAHTSTAFLAWIIISFARDLDNTRNIFHYGFLHSTPWSGFTFYCLCFIFMCFPSAVMFSLSPLMKSLFFANCI